jgi:hypothetical protein
MTELRTAHTADLDAGARSAIRGLRLAAGIAVVNGAGGFACR